MRTRYKLVLKSGLPVLLWAAGILIFFRSFFLSGGDLIIGDMADGQLIQSIHEHWFMVIQGKSSWHDLEFFFPINNTLGYSDTFLLSGIPYTLLRLGGADMFIAFQVVQMLLATLGYAGMFFWLRRFRGIGFTVSAWGAFVFIVASPFFIATRNSHIQLLSIWLLPILASLLEMTIGELHRPGRKLGAYAALFASVLGLLTYSTFYAAFFFCFGLTLVVLFASAIYSPREVLKKLKPPKASMPWLFPAALVLSVFLALFIKTYLPIRMEYGGRPFREVILSLPQPWDLFNHSTTNLFWGKVNSFLWSYPNALKWELETSIPLFTFLIALGGAISAVRQVKKAKLSRPDTLFAGLVLIVALVLICRIDSYTLWRIPYTLMPGASGIRAVVRINLALLIPAIFLACILVDHLWSKRGMGSRIAAVILMSIITLEQVQFVQNAGISRRENEERYTRSLPVPADAQVVFPIAGPQWGYQKDVPHSSALSLAQRWNLPIVNGRTGWVPKGWPLYELDPNTAYANLMKWAALMQIKEIVYLYDMDNGTWLRAVDFSARADQFKAGSDLMRMSPEEFYKIAVAGWAGFEFWGTRTSGTSARLEFPAMSFNRETQSLLIKMHGIINDLNPVGRVRIFAAGHEVETVNFTLERKQQEVAIPVRLPDGDPFTIEFHLEKQADSPEPGQPPAPQGFVLMSFVIKDQP